VAVLFAASVETGFTKIPHDGTLDAIAPPEYAQSTRTWPAYPFTEVRVNGLLPRLPPDGIVTLLAVMVKVGVAPNAFKPDRAAPHVRTRSTTGKNRREPGDCIDLLPIPDLQIRPEGTSEVRDFYPKFS
jgi:hypothetical protein